MCGGDVEIDLTDRDGVIEVPSVAKSAATMIALSGDELLMERNAELGPIGPQFPFVKGDGTAVMSSTSKSSTKMPRSQTRSRPLFILLC